MDNPSQPLCMQNLEAKRADAAALQVASQMLHATSKAAQLPATAGALWRAHELLERQSARLNDEIHKAEAWEAAPGRLFRLERKMRQVEAEDPSAA